MNHHHTEENAIAAHIVKPTETINRWNIVADPANASMNHRQADLAITMNTKFVLINPTPAPNQRVYSTGFAVMDALLRKIVMLHHAETKAMTYTPGVNTIRAIKISNAYTGCVTSAT